MARRWLLTVLTGTALGLGFSGTASATELLSEPVTVDAEVVEVSVTADTSERTLEAELATDLEVEEAGTDISPVVTATVAPEGPTVDVDGEVEVADTPVPVAEVTEPVEDAVGGTTPQQSAGSDVTPAPAPATAAPAPAGPAPAAAPERDTVAHSRTISADRAAVRSGLRAEATTFTFDDLSVLAPEVAPPADGDTAMVAAAAPTIATDLSLPVIDTTPTVPALLRLLAGLLVVGAAATWQTVRNEIA